MSKTDLLRGDDGESLLCAGCRYLDEFSSVPGPCLRPAVGRVRGVPLCGECEQLAIAETFFDGVSTERLRAIAAAGGLKALLAVFDDLRVIVTDYRKPTRSNTLPGRSGFALATAEMFQTKDPS